jgi:acetylornithine deacetylase/succinyl-diaminopimelate desuccinylase-like protein
MISRALLVGACMLTAAAASAQSTYEDMAVQLLREYVKVDTTNPPGNEKRATDFFKAVLEKEGIPFEVDEFAPGRANLLATLKGDGSKRALVLSNHTDVVAADPTRWTVPPFAGVAKDGLIYGRGVEDMKTEGILQLLALVRLKREGRPLARDVMFLATADEEADFAGALRALSAEGWRDRLAGAEYVVTEGGENIVDEAGKVQYFGIETGEKGPYWMKLRTTGTPGHGSRPIDDSALNRLIRALDRVRQHRTPMKVLPNVARLFRDRAAAVAEPRATWYRDIEAALRDPQVARTLYDDRDVSALLRNTISITVVKAGYKTNVIPGTAEAELDVRLLPGEDPQAFLAELRKVIDDPTVEIDPREPFRPPNQSPTDTDLFKTAEDVLRREFPSALITNKMLTGATECVLFRAAGPHCYGFTPLLTTEAEVSTGHGDDERIRESTVRRSVGVFYEFVRRLAGR